LSEGAIREGGPGSPLYSHAGILPCRHGSPEECRRHPKPCSRPGRGRLPSRCLDGVMGGVVALGADLGWVGRLQSGAEGGCLRRREIDFGQLRPWGWSVVRQF
jgi:hypothetical protein